MRGALMRRWTREEHIQLLQRSENDQVVADSYNDCYRGCHVTRQNVRYWRRIFLENTGNLARADREIANTRVFRNPQPDDDLGDLSFVPDVASSILVIPDQHAPYHHPDSIDFLKAVRDSFHPDLVVNLGDEVDMHAMSFHDSDPNLDSAGAELEKARVFLAELHSHFPEQLVCHSNHGSMLYRKAKAHGIPVQMLKSYREILFPEGGADKWSWAYSWHIDTPLGEVMFKHQSTGAVVQDAAHNQANLVVGHEHGIFGVAYAASSAKLYYGGHAGCLIDKDSLAFAYGKHFRNKPILGCMVILDGKPVPVPMVLKSNGRWRGYL